MVNEESIMKKKKRKKKRQSGLAGLDDSISAKNVKKKKVIKDSQDGGLKKKKKRKKSLKNSTLMFDPQEPIPNSQGSRPESDVELFGSQSPAPSPIKIQKNSIISQTTPIKSQKSPVKTPQSPPMLTKHIPAEPQTPNSNNEISEDSDEDSEEESPVKRAESRPSPVIKFAKKTKIVNNIKPNSEESPTKKQKVSVESEDSGAEEEDDVLAPLAPAPVKEDVKHVPAPLSDPVISQQEQDRRDLTLLTQIKDKFPDTLVKDINWNDLFVFDMKPEDMAGRYEILLNNIPREKNNSTLVNEALLSYCNAKVREVPLSKRGQNRTVGATGNWNMKKKLNAFSLFSSSFDLKRTSREEVKEKWDLLDKIEKKRLQKEAKALNNIHGIQSGMKTKAFRAISAYQAYSKEHMNLGMKMTEIGPKWKSLDEDKKKEYQVIADEANRERKASINEQLNEQSSSP